MAVVQQRPYITIYEKGISSTKLVEFSDINPQDPYGQDPNYPYPKNTPKKSIGLGILQPTVCRTTEVLNGTYELYLEHPIIENDPRASYIKVDNIIRADGQYFRIRKVNKKLSKNGDKVLAANALHIWYDLGDRFISKYDLDGWMPYWFLYNMFYGNPPVMSEEIDQNLMPTYNFIWRTTCEANPDPSVSPGYAHFKDTNPVACFIGTENAFVSIYQKEINGEIRTPELHRDNFIFRFDWRKYGAVDNAFNIIHKIDMTDITENIDIQNLITRLYAKDNYGHSTYLKIDANAISAAGGWLPAHHRTKAVEFQYNSGENDQYAAQRFAVDAERYFKQVSTVKLSYKCNYAELSNTELYKDYIAAKHCNVGDTGTIVCEALGITANNMEVIKKEKDVLKNETISLEFGTKSASLTDPKFMSQTVNNSKFNYSEVLPIGNVPNS